MAKKKSEEKDDTQTIDSSLDYRQAVLQLVKKQFGKDLIKTGGDFIKQENAKKIISLSPSLDVGSGGGVPEGSWVIFAGKHKCGKTVTILHFVKKCQEVGKHVYYLNIEGRLKKMNLVGTFGLDPDKLDVIESTEEKILSSVDYLNIAENIIRTHPGCVVVFDSYSMLCPEKELNEGVGTSTMGSPAAMLAQFFRQMSNVVPVKKTIVVGINQIMSNIGFMKSGDTEKGGKAIQYQGDVKFRHKMSESWKEGDKEVGKIVTWVVEWNALGNGAVPGSEVRSYLRYGYGLDELSEIIDIATDCGVIETAGAWMTCSFMQNHLHLLAEDKYEDEKLVLDEKSNPVKVIPQWDEETIKRCKAQGKAQLRALLSENPLWVKALRTEVGNLLGF